MDFRDEYGLPPKPRKNCPVCGLEINGLGRCRRRHDLKAVETYHLIKLLCKYIDEARKIK